MADLKTFRVYVRGDDPNVDVAATSFERVPSDSHNEKRGSYVFSESYKVVAQFDLDRVIGVAELPEEGEAESEE